jgi:hypothetical protein
MPVSSQHPEYIKALPRYKLIRAIINNDAKDYIRTPDADDVDRTKQYKEDAILTNFTKLTCEGLTGLVFRKELEVSLPSQLGYLLSDTTGSGINLYQFAQHTTYETLQTGRYGLLVDFHNDGEKAYIKPYRAETILNWKTAQINGVVQPYLIVLQEQVLLDSDDEFSQDADIQYRVLRLEDGVYSQRVYNAAEELVEVIIPTNYEGVPFNYIPFVCIGSENNDLAVDNQPMYDLAVLNLGHYRNSADYEESVFITGQPYLVIDVGETTQEDFNNANPNGVFFGSRRALTVNGGGATLLQANPNQLVAQAMNEKLQQAAKVGARLIEEAGGRETAEAAKIRYGSQHSALYTLTSNISWGIEAAVQMVAEFMGVVDDTIEFRLNTHFYDDNADANLLAQQIMLLDRGVISKEDIREYGRRTGFIDDQRTDAEIEADAAVVVEDSGLPLETQEQ